VEETACSGRADGLEHVGIPLHNRISADAEAGAVYVGLTSLALVLLLIGAAVRANTLADGAIPALGVSTLVGALALLGLQLAVWTSLHLSRDRLVNGQRSPASDV